MRRTNPEKRHAQQNAVDNRISSINGEKHIFLPAKVLLFQNNHGHTDFYSGGASITAQGGQSEVMGYRSVLWRDSERLRWIIPIAELNQGTGEIELKEPYIMTIEPVWKDEYIKETVTFGETDAGKLELILETLREQLGSKALKRPTRITSRRKGEIKKAFNDEFVKLAGKAAQKVFYYDLGLEVSLEDLYQNP